MVTVKVASIAHLYYNRLTCCKKSEKSNDGKYENFGMTDGLTDGAEYIGPVSYTHLTLPTILRV